MKHILYTALILFVMMGLTSCEKGNKNETYHLYFDDTIPQLQFAVDDLEKELSAKGISVKRESVTSFHGKSSGNAIVVVYKTADIDQISELLNTNIPKQKKSQSYSIRVNRQDKTTDIAVLANDINGAMYSVMDITEAIKLQTLNKIKDYDKVPYIEKRGIKFNISMDMRTPTYSSYNDASQQNIPEMWSMDFWKEMLDHLARDRYNVISLWNLHPFPSIVKVPEFPDVALNDVYRETKVVEGRRGNQTPIVLTDDNYEVVKTISIDEKIKFWKDVMQYGHDRGISFQWFTWNIFTHGTFGKYGIDDKQDNDSTIAYMRASVRELALTYPLLEGIGITAGENMENLEGEYSNEKWLWKTYGEGIRDAKKINPNINLQLIHRFHLSSQKEILDEWKDYPGDFNFSFKYLYAHMYSDTKSVFIEPALKYLAPNLKMWLELRNDDVYSFRWGDPDFAREFVKNLPSEEKMAGYYMGSDGYALGREFLSTEPESPRQLVMKKQWYLYMLWGRLSFDPTLSNEHFQNVLAERFPEVPADKLFKASQEASKIFPEITRFFWGDIDVRWFPEASKKVDRFYNIHDFIMQTTMPGSEDINIKVWRDLKINGEDIKGKTPFEVANSLETYAKNTLDLVAELRKTPSESKELRLTLGDYEAFAHLGNYYAEKIRGATNIALYDATGNKAEQDTAIVHLEKALDHWKKYGVIYTKQNVQPVKWGRAGIVDIQGYLTDEVAKDIGMAKEWKMGTIEGPLVKRKELNFRE
ncbi:hypothetical protein [Mariniflexile sp.]|uniref:hypothetical protein n=1 Tax=Mariniflexile sp. TaxID=1979402 RepID=UPI00404865BF